MYEPEVLIRQAAVDLSRFWHGQSVILVTFKVTTSTRKLADELTSCGAALAGVVAGGRSAPGMLPPVPLWTLPDSAAPVDRHAFDALLREPVAELAAWLKRIDPDGACVVVGTIWTEVEEVCGRPVHGWRRPDWARLEDKTRIEQLWTDIGVPSPRHAVLALDDPSLPGQAARLDTGRGVVLAMDSTRGIQGAGRGLRWARSPGELGIVLEELACQTDRVRIAEFVPGIPCSTQALVLDDGTAVFGAAEEVMLRSPRTGAFFYCGTSTWWHPGPVAAREIERHVRLAGCWLSERIGFRGMFTVDGVLTSAGFLATELNPRAGGGLGVRPGWPGFPVYLFQRAAQERLPGIVDLNPEAVENAFVDAIRRCPSYSGTVAFGPVRTTAPSGGTFTAAAGERISYGVENGAADILEIRPTRADRIIGPAMAQFAAALGTPGLVSFEDDTVRSWSGGVRQ